MIQKYWKQIKAIHSFRQHINIFCFGLKYSKMHNTKNEKFNLIFFDRIIMHLFNSQDFGIKSDVFIDLVEYTIISFLALIIWGFIQLFSVRGAEMVKIVEIFHRGKQWLFNLHSQRQGYWWPGSFRRQAISIHAIDLVLIISRPKHPKGQPFPRNPYYTSAEHTNQYPIRDICCGTAVRGSGADWRFTLPWLCHPWGPFQYPITWDVLS